MVQASYYSSLVLEKKILLPNNTKAILVLLISHNKLALNSKMRFCGHSVTASLWMFVSAHLDFVYFVFIFVLGFHCCVFCTELPRDHLHIKHVFDVFECISSCAPKTFSYKRLTKHRGSRKQIAFMIGYTWGKHRFLFACVLPAMSRAFDHVVLWVAPEKRLWIPQGQTGA